MLVRGHRTVHVHYHVAAFLPNTVRLEEELRPHILKSWQARDSGCRWGTISTKTMFLMTKPLEGHLHHKSLVDQNKEHQSVKLFLTLMSKTFFSEHTQQNGPFPLRHKNAREAKADQCFQLRWRTQCGYSRLFSSWIRTTASPNQLTGSYGQQW